jgi:hypothetical protein
MQRVRVIVTLLHLPRVLAEHAVGRDHTVGHRMVVGILLMTLGAIVTRGGDLLPAAHLFFDVTGPLLHAIGVTPFAEYLGDIR